MTVSLPHSVQNSRPIAELNKYYGQKLFRKSSVEGKLRVNFLYCNGPYRRPALNTYASKVAILWQ